MAVLVCFCCLRLVWLDSKWLVLFCKAPIQTAIILCLPTFSVFLPPTRCKESAQPNLGLLQGWAGLVCWLTFGERVSDGKKHLTPWGSGLTPELISDMLSLCVKRSLRLSGKRACFYHWGQSTRSLGCDKRVALCPLTFRKGFLWMELSPFASSSLFWRVNGCNYMLITCVWDLLSLHYR